MRPTLTVAERLQAALVPLLLRSPGPLLRALGGRPIVRDGRRIDPQVQLLLRLARLVGKSLPYERSVADARRDLEVSAVVLAPRVPMRVEEGRLADRPVRIYLPDDAGGGALVYFHGGGHVAGSLDSHDAPCRVLARDAKCVVISVDYRLAPEHPFPAAADDATAAFRAAVAEAEALGIDPTRIAVGGDSAGANLAAIVSLDTRADAVQPCLQLLVYPAVDLTMSFPSIQSLGRGFFLEADSIRWYRAHYLGDADPRHPRASPWFAEALSGLPPALVITAGFDPLRDEGEAYADRLRDAGVPVTYRCYDGLFHGFWNTSGTIAAAARPLAEACSALREAFETDPGSIHFDAARR